MTTCYINGKYKTLSDTTVSITDRGLQFGDGVYEIIAVYQNKVVDMNLHLRRLKLSLRKIDIKISLTLKQFENICFKIKKINELKMGILYIQITRGNQPTRDHKYPNSLKPNIIIYSINKDLDNMEKLASKGVKASLYPDIRWLRSDIKSTSLLGNVMAANFAKKNKSHEAILFDHNDNITEGNSSSIWIIKKDICYTHPISYRILKGCTRDKLIKILKTNNLQFKEKVFSLKSLLTADEVFMTSATNFVMPIIKIDKYKVSKGKPGPISLDLRKKFIKAI